LQEFGTLFYETSALNGENVHEAMDGLARYGTLLAYALLLLHGWTGQVWHGTLLAYALLLLHGWTGQVWHLVGICLVIIAAEYTFPIM